MISSVKAHHEDAVDRHFDGVGDLLGAEHPLRQLDADFARAENRAIGLLQDEAEAPGRQQRIQRALVEMADQPPFDQHAERAGGDECEHHREKEVSGKQRRQIVLEGAGGEPGDVGAEDHELAMGHVDDAHLAEDDGKPERHQHVDGKQDQARKALHDENGAEIANRIVAEHRCFSVGEVPRREQVRDAGVLGAD